MSPREHHPGLGSREILGDPEGARAQGNLPTIMPRLWAWLADVNNGKAFPC